MITRSYIFRDLRSFIFDGFTVVSVGFIYLIASMIIVAVIQFDLRLLPGSDDVLYEVWNWPLLAIGIAVIAVLLSIPLIWRFKNRRLFIYSVLAALFSELILIGISMPSRLAFLESTGYHGFELYRAEFWSIIRFDFNPFGANRNAGKFFLLRTLMFPIVVMLIARIYCILRLHSKRMTV